MIKFIWNDYLIASTILLHLITQAMALSVYVYFESITETVEIAEKVFFLREANPITFWITTLGSKLAYILYIVIEPAFLLTFYTLFRLKWLRLNSKLAFNMFTLLVFFSFLMVFLNDIPQFLGYMKKAGII